MRSIVAKPKSDKKSLTLKDDAKPAPYGCSGPAFLKFTEDLLNRLGVTVSNHTYEQTKKIFSPDTPAGTIVEIFNETKLSKPLEGLGFSGITNEAGAKRELLQLIITGESVLGRLCDFFENGLSGCDKVVEIIGHKLADLGCTDSSQCHLCLLPTDGTFIKILVETPVVSGMSASLPAKPAFTKSAKGAKPTKPTKSAVSGGGDGRSAYERCADFVEEHHAKRARKLKIILDSMKPLMELSVESLAMVLETGSLPSFVEKML